MRNIKNSLLVVLTGVLLTACGEGSSVVRSSSEVEIEQAQSDVSLLRNMALGVALNPVKIEKKGYSFELRTDGLAPKNIAKESTVIWGKSSATGDEIVSLEVHNGYEENTKFQVVVKDEKGEVVGSSEFISTTSGVDDVEYGLVSLDI